VSAVDAPGAPLAAPRPAGARRGEGAAGRRSGLGPTRFALAAFVLYLALAVAIYGQGVVAHPASTVVGTYGGDQTFFIWSLEHWARAVTGQASWFHTREIYAPQGFNLAWATCVPLLGVLLAPLTLLAGPVVAYNVAILAAPAATGTTMALLTRRLTASPLAALVAGAVFAFSTYGSTQELNHLNLASTALLPAALHLFLRRYEGDLRSWSFALLFGLALAGQFLVSNELFATGTVFALLAAAAGLVIAGHGTRRRLLVTAPSVLAGYGVAGILLLPYLFAMRHYGNPIHAGLQSDAFSLDVRNLFHPTDLTAIDFGRRVPVASLAGNLTEQVGYVGPIVPIVVVLAIAELRRSALAWTLAAAGSIALVSAFGPHLLDGGVAGDRMPWHWALRLPLLRYAISARFVLFLWIAIALLVGLWLARRDRARPLRLLVVAAAVVSLLPTRGTLASTGEPAWHVEMRTPSFFTSGAYRRQIAPGENVFVLPAGFQGSGMLWAAQTHGYFDMVGGYAASVLPPSLARYSIVATFYAGAGSITEEDDLRAFIRGQHVGVILVSRAADGLWDPLLSTVATGQDFGDVILYRVAPKPAP
jgi:hypothetical protein